MTMVHVTFTAEGRSVDVEEGKTILDAEIAAGIVPNAPCGGRGKCGKCKVKIKEGTVLACQTKARDGMTVDTSAVAPEDVTILMDGVFRPVAFDPGRMPEVPHPLIAAVDLGSTSIVCYLHDGKTGKQVGVQSALNPQRQFGGDVVQRASYALEHGAHTLSSCVRETIDTLLRELAGKIGAKETDITRVVMVGNSCMHHLFLEIPTDSLVLAPYEPKVKTPVTVRAVDVGLNIHPDAKLHWLANIGGFVGADTVGCILAADLEKEEKLTLMVDIGTNGEMVLGNRKIGLTACSTAAGPAFEGAKITCGMRGGTGAIDHVRIEDGKMVFHVIGDEDPVGICGSGLLDAAACMLKLGIIDDSGRLDQTYYFTDKVFMNQKDVRELQLAKAAISAGIHILCAKQNISLMKIEQVLLAGAFGNYLDPHSACAIGLLPRELEERIIPVGNAAGAGAQIAALNEGEEKRSGEIASRVRFVELALDPNFQDVYIDELSFGGEEE